MQTSPSELELRSFRDGDAEAILRLHDVALEDAGAHGGRGPWEDDLHDIRAGYLDVGGCFFVGLLDGALIAMGGYVRSSPTEVEIKRMRVHPDCQRRGFGRSLLERLESQARSIGSRTVRLDTTDRQLAARALYESAGYRETGRREVGRFLLIDYVKALDT